MDSQGGGKPLRDLMQEGYNGHIPILDMDDDNTKGRHGKRILQLINPTTAWISDANFDTLALVDNKEIRFPAPPMNSSPIAEKLYESIKILKSQMLSIIVTQTPRGVRHFDTPKKGQKKDLYSALILAAWGVREMFREVQEEEKILHAQGMMRQHKPGAKFATIIGGMGKDYLSGAVLNKKIN